MGYFWVDFSKIVNFLMESETKKDKYLQKLLVIVPFQKSVIWHTQGQGPANFWVDVWKIVNFLMESETKKEK